MFQGSFLSQAVPHVAYIEKPIAKRINFRGILNIIWTCDWTENVPGVVAYNVDYGNFFIDTCSRAYFRARWSHM